MKNQKEKIEIFVKAHFQAFNLGAEKVVENIDENAVIEYPYYAVTPIQMNRNEYAAQLSDVLQTMGEFTFTNLAIYATDRLDTFWLTVHGECTMTATGKLYQQDYVMRFSINENMRITHYVEYGNPLRIQVALTK